MKEYLFSIIIPHKNAPELLSRCIESIPVRNDIQIIVVDDNSDKDVVNWNSFHIEGRCFELIKTTKGGGAGYARNEGLKHALGKWVLFADCDDYYCEGFIDILEKYANSKFDVVFFYHHKVTESHLKLVETVDGTISKEEIERFKYLRKTPWDKMIRKSFIDNYGIHFEETINGNDLFFSYQVGFFCQEFAIEPSKLYCYYHNPNSLTHKKKNKDAFYLSIFIHRLQTKSFYNFVGHAEWGKSIFHIFLSILSKRGVKPFLQSMKVYVCNIQSIYFHRNDFVNYFRNYKR